MDRQELERLAKDAVAKEVFNGSSEALRDQGIRLYKAGFLAALESEMVKALRDSANRMREYIDCTLATLERNSRQRILSEDDWSEAMFLRDQYDEALVEFQAAKERLK